MMKERIAKYLRNALRKKRRNSVEQSLVAAYSVYRKLSDIVAKSDNRAICKLYLQSKNLKRNIVGANYSFITVGELVMWANEWLKSFPTTYDLIVGIPRSGLLVASIIGLKLGKPLTTPELFSLDRYWISERINREVEYDHGWINLGMVGIKQ